MFKKIINKIRVYKKFLFKLMLLVVLITLIPSILVNIFSYQNSKNLVEQQIIETNSNYLAQTVHAAEMAINQIEETFINFSNLHDLKSFESFQNGKYFESIRGSISPKESPQLYEYLINKQNVINLLSILNGSNKSFQTVYLMDYSKDLVLSNIGKEYSIDSFKKMEFGDLNENIINWQTMAKKDIIRIMDGSNEGKRVIPLVYSMDYQKNCLIINIDMDMLYKNILMDLDSKLENDLIIAAKENEYFYNTESVMANNFIRSIDIDRLIHNETGYEFMDLSNDRILMTKYKSQKYGWMFLSIIKLDGLYDAFNQNTIVILVESFMVLLATLLFGIIEARRFYRPVNSLVSLIKVKAAGDSAQKDELLLIENALRKSYTQNETMQEKLQESMMALQEKFIRLVLENQLSKKEIIEGFEYFGLEIIPYEIMILLISANYTQSDFQRAENNEHCKNSINEMLIEIIHERFKGITVEVKPGIFAAIINCSEDELSGVYLLSSQIQKRVSQEFNIDCIVSIGQICSDVTMLATKYQEIRQAMRSRYVSEKNSNMVFFINDVLGSDKALFLYSRGYEKLLNSCIKRGDKKGISKIINLMISKANQNQEGNTMHNVQYAALQILSNLLLLSGECGIDLEQCSNLQNNLYSELLSKETITSITHWLECLIDKIIDNISNEKLLLTNEYVMQVLNLIKNNYTMDISLTSIADGMGLNPSYLSRILKENTGKTLMEHLNEIRMENSKRLLLETEINVRTLSEKMGYNNSNYFIKVFKKYTGYTPGEFKKQYGARI